jgi:hypothetical protein
VTAPSGSGVVMMPGDNISIETQQQQQQQQ